MKLAASHDVRDPDDGPDWGQALQDAVRHALSAHPLEAAGLLSRSSAAAPRAEPWLGAAASSSHFSLDRYEDLARLEALCQSGAEVAVYHSHPDGPAIWSAIDAAIWTTPLGPSWRVEQVVIAVGAGVVLEVAGYRWSDTDHAFVERWRWAPAQERPR